MTNQYTIERVFAFGMDEKILNFLKKAAVDMNALYGDPFPCWEQMDMHRFADTQYLWVCRRDGVPVGFLAVSRVRALFDPTTVLMRQELLYSLPGTRASWLLLKQFVDFGKVHADHVITMIAPHTNIKRRSLERLGFKELEVLYRLEK